MAEISLYYSLKPEPGYDDLVLLDDADPDYDRRIAEGEGAAITLFELAKILQSLGYEVSLEDADA